MNFTLSSGLEGDFFPEKHRYSGANHHAQNNKYAGQSIVTQQVIVVIKGGFIRLKQTEQ